MTERGGTGAERVVPAARPIPSAATITACAAAGFALPWLSPVGFVRQCPEELRHSLPLLFAIDRPLGEGSTLLVGVAVNTVLWTLVLVAATITVDRLPALRSVAVLLRRNRRNILSLLIPAVVLIALAGVESPTLTTAIGPGHVDTPACRHVNGHTRVANWWGPNRFDLLDVDRLLP